MSATRNAPLRTLTVAAFGTALASGLGWLVLADLAAPPGTETPRAQLEGKISDRLSFVEEDVPVRQTRIYDTLAMFSMETAESRPWSDRSVPTLAALDPGPGGLKARPPAMPRMVVAERAPARHQMLPPSRPIAAATAIIPVRIAAAPAESVREPVHEPSREPVRLLGWDLPGSQHLPTRRDAVKTAEMIGDRAVKVGSGTASLVTDAASAVGETVSAVGSTVAGTVGWR